MKVKIEAPRSNKPTLQGKKCQRDMCYKLYHQRMEKNVQLQGLHNKKKMKQKITPTTFISINVTKNKNKNNHSLSHPENKK